jgi:hypothetical protein
MDALAPRDTGDDAGLDHLTATAVPLRRTAPRTGGTRFELTAILADAWRRQSARLGRIFLIAPPLVLIALLGLAALG